MELGLEPLEPRARELRLELRGAQLPLARELYGLHRPADADDSPVSEEVRDEKGDQDGRDPAELPRETEGHPHERRVHEREHGAVHDREQDARGDVNPESAGSGAAGDRVAPGEPRDERGERRPQVRVEEVLRERLAKSELEPLAGHRVERVALDGAEEPDRRPRPEDESGAPARAPRAPFVAAAQRAPFGAAAHRAHFVALNARALRPAAPRGGWGIRRLPGEGRTGSRRSRSG